MFGFSFGKKKSKECKSVDIVISEVRLITGFRFKVTKDSELEFTVEADDGYTCCFIAGMIVAVSESLLDNYKISHRISCARSISSIQKFYLEEPNEVLM